MGLQKAAGTITNCYYVNPQVGSPANVCTVSGAKKAYATAPDNLVNPVFSGVTVKNKTPEDYDSSDHYVTFRGIYSPTTFTADDRSILYLGAENKLYWPSAAVTLGACRAYFKLNDGLTAGDPTSGADIMDFHLNFDGETTEIKELKDSRIEELKSDGAWYTLDGRKLSGKPTQKGVYIHGGHKVVVHHELEN